MADHPSFMLQPKTVVRTFFPFASGGMLGVRPPCLRAHGVLTRNQVVRTIFFILPSMQLPISAGML